MLPYLRFAAQKMTRRDFYILIAICFLFVTSLPSFNTFLSALGKDTIVFNSSFAIPLATYKVIFFPMIGYYLDKKVDIERISGKKVMILTFLALFGILIASAFTYYEGVSQGGFTQNYVQMFDYLIAIWAFVLIKWLFVKKRIIIANWFRNIICILGTLSFGIYLFDPFVKSILYLHFEAQVMTKLLSDFWSSILWCIISMVVGGLATYILKKIPLLNKII